MTIKKEFFLRGVSLLVLFSSIVISNPAFSEIIKVLKATENGGATLSAKASIDLFTRKNIDKKNFTARAAYNFHPSQLISETGITLNIEEKKLNTTSFDLNYNKKEEHGTGGTALFKLSVTDVEKEIDNTKVKGLQIKADITASIKPGINKDTPVSVRAQFVDPISFSDSDPLATFLGIPEGIDFSPFLDVGFGVDIDPNGLSETLFDMSAYALVGSITDPDVFAGLATGNDLLYQLTIKSMFDSVLNKQIAIVDLAFNSPIGFTLEVTDALGSLVNMNDLNDIAAIENSIMQAFTEQNGFFGLASSISPFTVGVTPDNSVSEFSIGQQGSVEISAIEVPEPPTFLLFLTAALMMFSKRKPRQEAAGV